VSIYAIYLVSRGDISGYFYDPMLDMGHKRVKIREMEKQLRTK